MNPNDTEATAIISPVIEKYQRRARAVNSLLCVGLDSQWDRLPARFAQDPHPQFAFNRWIIDQTAPFASAFKPNLAFYEARGPAGMDDLKRTMDYLRETYPDILTIGDAKRGDIGSTNAGYVAALFDGLGFDAVTLHPYLGQEALTPFLERGDKGCIILCRTSNRGAGEFQDLRVHESGKGDRPLWQVVAERVAGEWNTRGNCMLVVGATYPDEMRVIRQVVGEMTLLVPGVGAQGGDVEQTVAAGANRAGEGLMISVSRAVLFAPDPAAEARRYRDEINRYRPGSR